LGYEFLRTQLYQQSVNATGIGPASVASHNTNLLGETPAGRCRLWRGGYSGCFIGHGVAPGFRNFEVDLSAAL